MGAHLDRDGWPKDVNSDFARDALEKAAWTAAYVNDLPDDAFLFVESGGEKDDDGKTVPRALRHFPVRSHTGEVSLPHLRNALSRIPQSNVPLDAKERMQATARRMLDEEVKKANGA